MAKRKATKHKKKFKKGTSKKKFSSKLLKTKILKNEKNIRRFIFFGTLITIFSWLFWGIPLPTKISTNPFPVSTKLFDRKGEVIYEIYADRRSTPVSLENLPEYAKQATIAIEDKNFFRHHGLSFTGVARAAYNTIFKSKLQGGSTLTQQLVKNSLLTPERTIKRKIREFVLTVIVETIYSKNDILNLYLNQMPYGSTAYGIGSASELYFDKEAQELNLAEATLLAGLPAAPSRFSPFGSHPELAKGRQEIVLRRMVEDGYITDEQAQEAKNFELEYAEPERLKAPHFALWVKELLAQEYGDSVVEKGGLRVSTTLDMELQNFAELAVATEVAKLKKYNVGNGAALVTRPKTGEILAMVGSKDYFADDEDGKVNIIFANRQPGSSIKPLNYALAVRDGKITASSPLADVPTCFEVLGQKKYCPKNYDGNFHGAVQARFALGNSYNIPAVRVLALNGVDNFIKFAKQMGITTFIDPSLYGLSLTLGGGEVKPYDMAQAFGVLANKGVKQPLIPITKVEDWKGKVLFEVDIDSREGESVLSKEVSFIISHILHDNNARAQAFGEYSLLNAKGHPEVSVKTGTTNDRRDNWTIGYTQHALVITWVGNNNNSSMGGAVSGVSGASPIWNKIMQEVLEKAESGYYDKTETEHVWPKQPENVIGANVCTTTGIFAENPEENVDCPSRFEYFIKEHMPEFVSGGFQDVHFDRTTGGLINEATPPENIEIKQFNVLYDALGTFVCLDCPIPASSHSATISYPLIN